MTGWMTRLFLIAALGALALPLAIAGEFLHADKKDAVRPQPYAADRTLDGSATGSIAALKGLADGKPEQDDGTALKAALSLLADGRIADALTAGATVPRNTLDHQILSWALALDGGMTSNALAASLKELAAWPGQAAVRRNLERALLRENAAPDAAVTLLAGAQPLTFQGIVALTGAHLARGEKEKAEALIISYWRKARLEAPEEARILRDFGTLIPVSAHRARMEQMLHFDRVSSAERVAERAGAVEIAKAWGAVLRKQPDAGKLLDAVPAEQRKSAAYIFAKSRHLRWSGKYKEAAEMMLRAPTEASLLVDPDAWWIERRVLSRELLDLGDARTAYELAAAHAAESPANAADAEFHAGWYALQGLHDASRAAPHFARIAEIAEGPISLARAHYWLGRTAEADKRPQDAQAFFARAAHYGTTFYGQLAAARLGNSALMAEAPLPSPSDKLAFAARPAVQAITRLEALGQTTLADLLYRDLAGELASPGEVALLSGMAQQRGDHFLALRVGKLAAARGLDIGALTHPMGAIPGEAQIGGAGAALAYAIARQESEFNVGAVSRAGARGLLQLMPGTAQAMAKRAGLAYSASKLTTDAAYNATLGATYLDDQLARFDGSYVLTFAGYNAGPRRAAEWAKRYGDPREMKLDAIVDWIERIPYTETRSYVQRVMENYQVYKARLSGKFDITADLTRGR